MEIHQKKLVETAMLLNIEVEFLESKWQLDAVRLRHAKQTTTVLYGRIFSHLNYIADAIAANKIAAKELMTELGIPTPKSLTFTKDSIDTNKIQDFIKRYSPVVAKPMEGTDGLGIAMHLSNSQQVISHLQQFQAPKDIWLLEQQVQGQDLRIQYLSGRIIAACIRKPCTLVGDGISTISQLINSRNSFIQSQNPENFIDIDHQVKHRLREAGFTLNTTLTKGKTLAIKDVSNMAQGGHAIDVTYRVHPNYQRYLDDLSKVLEMKFFSLDVMTPEPESNPDEHAHVLEFNAQSAWIHHTFSEVRQHNIAKIILEDFFDLALH